MVFLSASGVNAGEPVRTFGDCILDPDAKSLQEQWRRFHDLRVKRAKVNIRLLPRKILLPETGRELIEAVMEAGPLLDAVQRVEKKFLKSAFRDKRFNLLISDPAFLDRIRSGAAQEEIRDSDLAFKDDPGFLAILREIEEILRGPGAASAIEVFRRNDLGILDPVYRASAVKALRYLAQKGATMEGVRAWKGSPPLMADVPLPPLSLGAFSVKYHSLLSRAVEDFIEDHQATYEDARSVLPGIKAAEWELIEKSGAPTEKNAFDQHILSRAWIHRDSHEAFSFSVDEYGAIDGVTRTLWGEASSCQNAGFSQFEAISKIIADRALSIERAKSETSRLEEERTGVREKNWMRFLRNWVGIRRSAGGMQADPSLSLRGMADFGRKEKADLDPSAQVISRKGQFSVWNSFALKKFAVQSPHRNIPRASYSIQGPQSSQDDQALTRILCPVFQNQRQKELWNHAEALASDLVLNRKALSERYHWPTRDLILFYTHEAALPFAREVKVGTLLEGGAKLKINGKGTGPCSRFRLFAPKGGQRY
ncbi:MAG: hypothetical protein EBX52_03120 [Proteobacteria bacterium]|nr:hypothetical protein [Pseudomonadota bacterium]